MLHRDVAPGIHRIEDSFVNWYLIEEGTRLTVVDAGLPTSWDSLQDALRTLGRSVADVEAVVLTHAHFDHVGFAERIRGEHRVPILVHEDDVPLTKHPLTYTTERSPLPYLLNSAPRSTMFSILRSGALWAKRIAEVERFGDDGVLDVPGSPQVVYTPGHTLGHVALHLPDRDAVIVGDALVTINPYTGAAGPQLISQAATADSVRAMGSLDRLAETGASTLLPGHGPPWTGGAAEAARRARAAGLS